MVQSAAITVDAWFAEVDQARKSYFEQIRALALARLGATTEQMRYGMPCYVRPDDLAPCFAYQSQKAYLALYVNPDLHQKYAENFAGLNAGKSCLRYRRGEAIDMTLLDRILADTAVLPRIEY